VIDIHTFFSQEGAVKHLKKDAKKLLNL